jgi:hypothetical protein
MEGYLQQTINRHSSMEGYLQQTINRHSSMEGYLQQRINNLGTVLCIRSFCVSPSYYNGWHNYVLFYFM